MIAAPILLLIALAGDGPRVVLEAPRQVSLGEPILVEVTLSGEEAPPSPGAPRALDARNLSFDVRYEDGTAARFHERIDDPAAGTRANESKASIRVDVPSLAVGRWTFTPHALVAGQDLVGVARDVDVVAVGDVIAYGLEIETSRGVLRAELDPKSAPAACIHVARCCRLPGFGPQQIDRVWSKAMLKIPPVATPEGPSGGAKTEIELDPSPLHHVRGSLSLWREGIAGEDLKKPTNQGVGDRSFFVLTEAEPWMDGRFCVFGRVAAGIEVADEIVKQPLVPAANGELSKPKEPARVISVKLVPMPGKPK